jgi:hypothetical protein
MQGVFSVLILELLGTCGWKRMFSVVSECHCETEGVPPSAHVVAVSACSSGD